MLSSLTPASLSSAICVRIASFYSLMLMNLVSSGRGHSPLLFSSMEVMTIS